MVPVVAFHINAYIP